MMASSEPSRSRAIRGVSVALLLVGGVALVVGSPWFGLLLVGGGLAGLGVRALLSGEQRDIRLPTLDEVSTPSRARLRPIVKLREELIRLSAAHKDNPVVSAMASDMSETVDAIVIRSVQILEAKRKVQSMTSPAVRARAAVADLETRLQRETDPQTRESIEAALTARRAEVQTMSELELTAKRLEANLNEAESALAELRSQVLSAVAQMSGHEAEEEIQPFSEITMRLRRVSATMDESVETVSGKWA
jgi:hypothetical protein